MAVIVAPDDLHSISQRAPSDPTGNQVPDHVSVAYRGVVIRVDELRARVAAGYERLDMPSWPDPHPDMEPPGEEEHSRYTGPERYRVVHGRARMWADVLGDVPGVRVVSVPPLDVKGPDRFDRGVRITSSRSGTLPLLLLESDVWLSETEGTMAGLRVSVARPEVSVETLPQCGCDACDSGSADLLEVIDEVISTVVGGPFVALRAEDWRAQWHPNGWSWSAGGTGPDLDLDQLTAVCRRLVDGADVPVPDGAEAFVGRAWFD